MKRPFKIILVVLLLLLYTTNGAFADEPQCSAKAAILLDGNSGRILYAKNINERLPMASTTKIMTAIVAIEEGNINDIVTVPPQAQGVEGSSIWLSAGEKHTLEDLLYGLMLRSGNDAATAIAYHIGGSIEGFAQLMNKKAAEIGANNTHFVNPHGLHDDNHYTTAYDLGQITAYGLRNPIFKEVVSTKNKTIPWEGHEWDRAMRNKNKLLWQYEGATGVKTGFTKKAGRCLVSSASRDDLDLVAVVLNCGPMFQESMDLFDYGFSQFKNKDIIVKGMELGTIPVEKGKDDSLKLIADGAFKMAVREGEEGLIRIEHQFPEALKAPVEKGKEYGKIKVYFDGKAVSEISAVSANEVEKRTFWDILKNLFKAGG